MAQATHDTNEVPFSFDELFFSRTDEAGIIRFGNAVFQRVSIYEWDELLNKPHKIVRHPDTPRAVFHLLWDTIKGGWPIGAYVKNRAKDGRHYWVYAIVTPVEGGFLSVRLKPSSDVFKVVRQLYPEFSAMERQQKLEPGESAGLLMERIQGLGFETYTAFMTAALGKELAARDAQLGNPADPTLRHFDLLLDSARHLQIQAGRIIDAYKLNEIVPTNFRILASQLGQEGAAIGVISNNYAMLSEEMRGILETFVASAKDVEQAISVGYFMVSTVRVQRELVDYFVTESDSAANITEMDLLSRQRAAYIARAKAGLQEIGAKVAGFRQSCLELNRLATGLEVMRVIGKTECSRHLAVKDRVDKLLSDLQVFQRTIAGALREIESLNNTIEVETDLLIEQADAAA
ncbi:MAG: PAS domain-containing protein [Hyphomonas sp.]|uniref:PAS domain-containing protein n=1 Tax=Hyphomonas sp. TaxID=87 RepID=UPI003529779F